MLDPMTVNGVAPSPPPEEGFAVLSRRECLESLEAGGVGRVAVNVDGVPGVFPVRFALTGGDLVCSALLPATDVTVVRDSVVAMEADLLDPAIGWSVVVTGVARDIPDDPGPSFRISTDVVSGRQILRSPMHVAGTVRDGVGSPRHHPSGPGRPGGTGRGPARFHTLPAAECFRLLASREVGRLAVLVDGQPRLFPVNYALDGDAIVFRTASGTKLEALSRSLVAFEVDRFEPPPSMTGWTVVVEGLAQEVTSADSPGVRERLARLPLHPWASGDRDHFVRILATSVTGTRCTRR